MDELKAYKLKKAEEDIQVGLDLMKESGMSEDEIAAAFARIVEDVDSGRIRS